MRFTITVRAFHQLKNGKMIRRFVMHATQEGRGESHLENPRANRSTLTLDSVFLVIYAALFHRLSMEIYIRFVFSTLERNGARRITWKPRQRKIAKQFMHLCARAIAVPWQHIHLEKCITSPSTNFQFRFQTAGFTAGQSIKIRYADQRRTTIGNDRRISEFDNFSVFGGTNYRHSS